MNIIRLALILFLIYFSVRLFTRYLLPILLKHIIKKTQKKFFDNQQPPQPKQQKKEKGKTTVDYIPNDHKKKDNDLGEYIDFEEIDDKDNNK